MFSYLESILTPEFLSHLVDAFIPIDKKESVDDFAEAVRQSIFSSEDDLSPFWPKLRSALKAISEYGLDHLPDWMSFLPPVENVEFPKQALGLQLVLDQAPRIFLKGIDQRWTSEYFDEASIQYALQLDNLSPQLRPSAWERWQDSVTFEYWILLRLFYGAPIVHNEKTADAAVKFTDDTRFIVERHFNVCDPIRSQPEQRWDLFAFPRLVKSGGPESPCDVPTGAFWIQQLMDAHKPPLERFGHYPYRNWVMGRDMTPDEEDWLDKAEVFRPPPEDVIKKIKQDVEQGVWTPLYDNE